MWSVVVVRVLVVRWVYSITHWRGCLVGKGITGNVPVCKARMGNCQAVMSSQVCVGAVFILKKRVQTEVRIVLLVLQLGKTPYPSKDLVLSFSPTDSLTMASYLSTVLKTTKLYYTKNYRNYNKVKSVRVVVNRTVRIVTRMVRIVIKIDGWVIGW